MTKDTAISHYNRLQGTLQVIAELSRHGDAPEVYKEDLNIAIGRIVAAQGKLPWSPETGDRTRG